MSKSYHVCKIGKYSKLLYFHSYDHRNRSPQWVLKPPQPRTLETCLKILKECKEPAFIYGK